MFKYKKNEMNIKKTHEQYSQPITEANAFGNEKSLVLNVYFCHLDIVEEVCRAVINFEINIKSK